MKWSMFLPTILICVLCAESSSAGDYANGYVTPGGYCYHASDGYWYLDGCAYTRCKEYFQQPYTSYYWNGCTWVGYCAYREAYNWVYTKVVVVAPVVVATPVTTLPSYTDSGWRGKLLDVAAQRDRFEGEIRKSAQEQQSYLEAVAALGLAGNFRWPNYGALPVVGGYGNANPNLGSYGTQGASIYGYGQNRSVDVYGETNLNALYQQAARLTQNAQTLAGQAHGEFSELATQAGANASSVAEINAKGRAAAAALTAARSQPHVRAETRNFTLGNGGSQPVVPNQSVVPDQNQLSTMPFAEDDPTLDGQSQAPILAPNTRFDAALVRKTECASCHSGPNLKGGFDILKWQSFDTDKKRKVWERLIAEEPDKLMPRGENGKGHRLSAAKMRAFME